LDIANFGLFNRQTQVGLPLSHSFGDRMNQQQQGGGYPAGDFWDVKDQAYAGQQQPDHAFSELVEVKYTQSSGKLVVVALLALLLIAVAGFAGYEYFVNERDPITTVMNYFGVGKGDSVEATQPKKGKKSRKLAAPTFSEPKPVKKSMGTIPANPYWELPNRIVGMQSPPGRIWSSDEESTFRAGLNHTFTYQQHKAVMDVRKLKLSGSDAILWEALENKKFWTRIWAAIGLAEFNNEVSLETLENVVEKARSELIATFLERLQKNLNPGQVFIARQLVKILDERGRLSALKVIYKSNDKLRDVYLAAATVDPGKKVQRWARFALGRKPMNPDKYNDMMEVVRGNVDGNFIISGEKITPVKQPEFLPSVMEEDDFTGEIEFFEEDMTNLDDF